MNNTMYICRSRRTYLSPIEGGGHWGCLTSLMELLETNHKYGVSRKYSYEIEDLQGKLVAKMVEGEWVEV